MSANAVDNYKFCVAYAVNECRSGSAAGDIFFNVPSALTYPFCTGGDAPNPLNNDVCITNAPSYSGTLMQLSTAGTDSATSQAKSRNLTYGLAGVKDAYGFPLAKSFADGTYALFTVGVGSGTGAAGVDTWKVKLPPMPTPDGVDRTTFVRAPVSITTPGSLGIATASVDFGYGEFGTVTQHYCTSRAEACVAGASTVTDATPFQYKTTDTPVRLSCASSCTITLPVLPMHQAYYQVEFYDGSGVNVAHGPSGVASEGTVVSLGASVGGGGSSSGGSAFSGRVSTSGKISH